MKRLLKLILMLILWLKELMLRNRYSITKVRIIVWVWSRKRNDFGVTNIRIRMVRVLVFKRVLLLVNKGSSGSRTC